MSDTAPVFRWQSAAISHRGCVRKINEDACLELPGVGLWVVADGMGGHAAGDVASQLIVESLREVRWRPRLAEMVDEVEQRLDVVNARLIEIAAQSEEPKVVGSTVAVLVALRRHGMCLWAGDSRVYRIRTGLLSRITRDHSEVEDLLDQGLVQPEEVDSHPSANVVTRAVGGSEELELDSVRIELRDADRFLLCSDGLYKELSDAEIAEYLQQGTCEQACRALVEFALARGSRDNVTVVVVQFNEAL